MLCEPPNITIGTSNIILFWVKQDFIVKFCKKYIFLKIFVLNLVFDVVDLLNLSWLRFKSCIMLNSQGVFNSIRSDIMYH